MAALLDDLSSLVRAVVAVPAAMLPRRHWDALPALPVSQASSISGLLTGIAGLVVGARGLMAYSGRVSDAVIDAAMNVPARQARHEIPAGIDVTTFDLQSMSAISPIAFLFFTPLGLFAGYLVISGFARAVSAYVGQPLGDPALTGLDSLIHRLWRRTTTRRARLARERAEGPEVPDRLCTGEWAGLIGVDYVVVASRQKPEWTAGTTVVTPDKWYTLGKPFELRLPQGLRTIYPLTEQKVTEVLRRGVRYDLPPLTGTRAR